MLTVKLETVLTIAVMSTPPELVRSARHGTARNHTNMDGEVLDLTTSAGILMVNLMPGAIPWIPPVDGSFVRSGNVMSVTNTKMPTHTPYRHIQHIHTPNIQTHLHTNTY